MMLQNYVEEKDRFKVPDRSIAFNVADSSLVSAFILQVTLKLLLLEFWRSIKEKYPQFLNRLLKYSSLSQLHICVKLDFLHIIQQQPKKQKTKKKPHTFCNTEKRVSSKQILKTFRMTDYNILIRETTLDGFGWLIVTY